MALRRPPEEAEEESEGEEGGPGPRKMYFSFVLPLFFLYPIFFGRQKEGGEKGALLGLRYRSGTGLWSCKKNITAAMAVRAACGRMDESVEHSLSIVITQQHA